MPVLPNSRVRTWKILVNDLVHGHVQDTSWLTAVAQAVQFLEEGYLYGRMEIREVEPVVLDAQQSRISVLLADEYRTQFAFHLEEVRSVVFTEEYRVNL